jgi:hypothetical protein
MKLQESTTKSRVIKLTLIAIIVAVTALATKCYADNPIVQTKFTADPAPMVYHDTIFLYTSHDEDDAPQGMGGFKMCDWLCYTTTDMVNWTDHGAVASLNDFSWVKHDNGAWAPQCIERGCKFYLYCPVQGNGIGVLVANSPYGPFEDPLGKRLIETDHLWNDIDPTVFIDEDDQAYLYWGNPDLYYVKLNKDMISYSGKVVKVPTKPKNYQEGPWFYKRNGHYYLAYASTCCPEGIGYAMSNSPAGPWEYKGYIMKPNPKSSGNHPGIIDYKGHSYVFGFNYQLNSMLTNIHHERRSVCMEEFKYNPDGTIPELPWWSKKGVRQIGTLNPFIRTEAVTIAWESGVKTKKGSKDNMYVTDIDNGDYIKAKGVNFENKRAKSFEASVASASKGGKIEIHLDSLTGTLLGVCPVKNTGGWQNWNIQSCKVKKEKGIHDVYFVFKGDQGDLFNFDWWKFNAN